MAAAGGSATREGGGFMWGVIVAVFCASAAARGGAGLGEVEGGAAGRLGIGPAWPFDGGGDRGGGAKEGRGGAVAA